MGRWGWGRGGKLSSVRKGCTTNYALDPGRALLRQVACRTRKTAPGHVARAAGSRALPGAGPPLPPLLDASQHIPHATATACPATPLQTPLHAGSELGGGLQGSERHPPAVATSRRVRQRTCRLPLPGPPTLSRNWYCGLNFCTRALPSSSGPPSSVTYLPRGAGGREGWDSGRHRLGVRLHDMSRAWPQVECKASACRQAQTAAAAAGAAAVRYARRTCCQSGRCTRR